MYLLNRTPHSFIFSFFVVLFLFLPTNETQAQSLIKQWKNADASEEWYFTDNSMGKRFRYIKDTLRIVGEWQQKGNLITLEYVFKGDSIGKIVNTPPPPPPAPIDTLASDSLALATPPPPPPRPTKPKVVFPLPRQLTASNLTDNSVTLMGDDKKFQLSYSDNRNAFFKFFDNRYARGILGMFLLLLFTFLCSTNKRAINWVLVAKGVLLQLVFALLILKVEFVYKIFQFISKFFVKVLEFTKVGSDFIFGNLMNVNETFGYIFAVQVLPTVIFFSALTSALYYLGILQKIVYGFAWVMSKLMRLSGAESLAAAANIFIGQTEAPLTVKPYLDKMTRSEMMCLMTGGMATIAGGVFAAFVGMLGGADQQMQLLFATHLLSASIMSAPAAIVAAKILVPETNYDAINSDLNISNQNVGSNLLDAISNGTIEGLKLAVNVGAMLLAFYALIAMVDSILFDVIGYYTGLNEWVVEASSGRYKGFTLASIFGTVFAPVAWIIGVPMADISSVGELLGQKTLINEFVAYTNMGIMQNGGILMEEKSLLIATYALCGFSNFASIGIQIGGIGTLAPNRRTTLAEFGILALIGGTVACFLTATIAGMLIG